MCIIKFLILGPTTNETILSRYGKTEVCLTLSNKFDIAENEDSNLNKLFIKTKELLVSVMRFLQGNTLTEALETTLSPNQEKSYDAHCLSTISVLNTVHNRYNYQYYYAHLLIFQHFKRKTVC